MIKLIALVLLFSTSIHAQTAKLGIINKVVAASSTPEALTSSDLLVKKAWLAAPSDNTGLVFIGLSAATATAANGIVLPKGSATVAGTILNLESDKSKINLKEIFVGVATNGDHVNVFYIE